MRLEVTPSLLAALFGHPVVNNCLSNNVSVNPLIEVIGVRSSCDTFATKSFLFLQVG